MHDPDAFADRGAFVRFVIVSPFFERWRTNQRLLRRHAVCLTAGNASGGPLPPRGARAARVPVLVKIAHTAIWAVLASAILALPVAGLRGETAVASLITLFVAAEGIVLGLSDSGFALMRRSEAPDRAA